MAIIRQKLNMSKYLLIGIVNVNATTASGVSVLAGQSNPIANIIKKYKNAGLLSSVFIEFSKDIWYTMDNNVITYAKNHIEKGVFL